MVASFRVPTTGWMTAEDGVRLPPPVDDVVDTVGPWNSCCSNVAFLRSRVSHACNLLVPIIPPPPRRLGNPKILDVSGRGLQHWRDLDREEALGVRR